MASVSRTRADPLAVAPTAEPGAPPFPVRLFTVEEYYRLLEAGFFDEDYRFELLEGWIVPQMTKNPPHDVALELAGEALRPLVRGLDLHVRTQGSVRTLESVPEPDLAIARGQIRDFSKRHPLPSEAALVVEIAESSLRRDRTIKMRIYARAAIPTYWIINLVDRQVEVYSDPTGPEGSPAYRSRRDYRPGDVVPLRLDDRDAGQIAVDDLLP